MTIMVIIAIWLIFSKLGGSPRRTEPRRTEPRPSPDPIQNGDELVTETGRPITRAELNEFEYAVVNSDT